MIAKLKAEVTKLKAKLKKAEAELKKLKATSLKPMTPKEAKALEDKLEKIFNQGYQEALKDMQRAEDAFEKHMDKAVLEFEKKIFPKLKQAIVIKAKKKPAKAKKIARKSSK
jgi:hypothetical protein